MLQKKKTLGKDLNQNKKSTHETPISQEQKKVKNNLPTFFQ